MKPIALLHYSCPPIVGGVEEICRQQASLFHRYHHPVKMIAGSGSQFTDEFKVEINPMLSSRNHKILKHQENTLDNKLEIQRLSQEIFNYLEKSLSDFEFLIAHNVLTMHYNLPLTKALHQLAKKNSIKVISWNHDSPFFYRTVPKGLQEASWNILKKFNPQIHYVTISDSRAKEFAQLYHTRQKLKVIPNGIDPIDFFKLDMTTVRLILEQNLFLADLIIVQPSRLHPRKNIELSVQVLKALHDLGINAKLLLTGAYDHHERKTTTYYYRLKNLADELQVSKHLIVVAEYEFESGEKLKAHRVIMRDLYQISDVLFLPSKQEGFGIPLLEAGMIKLPIICSDIPPFRSIAAENVLYFSLKDPPEALAKNILTFLSGCKTFRMYRNVIVDYVWDNIYQKHILPLLNNL